MYLYYFLYFNYFFVSYNFILSNIITFNSDLIENDHKNDDIRFIYLISSYTFLYLLYNTYFPSQHLLPKTHSMSLNRISVVPNQTIRVNK